MSYGGGHLVRDISFFVAILATAIALGGALAHAFEFFSKMRLSREDYFVVQTIYAGWNRLAYVLLLELLGIVALIVLYRKEPTVMWPAVAALAFLLASQAIFWIWTYPANIATNNWTQQPENWQELRQQWEYSHFAGAIFQGLTMTALIVGVLRR
ncbi:DUF1772 domain-containing protein [Roseovarius spongiae]|uniref:DUF1772 domain-containing protein n=1 Tax=Roseovarius spongiae TaxID=2320272 RepID=A0A3A8BAP9_9RHOB|nr:DUF1772 domain-containing protein [Roseovarius spongiae]RKF16292.1 DUF1772 domain-containing protein [Roseovarius spongiae]